MWGALGLPGADTPARFFDGFTQYFLTPALLSGASRRPVLVNDPALDTATGNQSQLFYQVLACVGCCSGGRVILCARVHVVILRARVHVCVRACVCACVYVCARVCACVYVCACVHASMCARVCVRWRESHRDI